MLKLFEEFEDLNTQLQNLKDLCENTLAYLVDDGLEVKVENISRTKYNATTNSFLIRLIPSKKIFKKRFLRIPRVLSAQTWADLKDSVIPLIQLLNKRYHLLDQEEVYKRQGIAPISIYTNIYRSGDTIDIQNITQLESIDNNLNVDIISMTIYPNMMRKKVFKGIWHELDSNGKIVSKEVFEEFTEETLKKNVDTYNHYFNTKQKRTDKVAWERAGSQSDNFRLVTKLISPNESILDYGCGMGDLLPYLQKKGKEPSQYLGVDINQKFIQQAKEDYPDQEFKVITDIDQVTGSYDNVCVIGVFTWFITKEDFIKSIQKLWSLSNKRVLLTCIYSNYTGYQRDTYWESSYRYYNPDMFRELFPDLNFKFERNGTTMLVIIEK